jgi:hypothetical protein
MEYDFTQSTQLFSSSFIIGKQSSMISPPSRWTLDQQQLEASLFTYIREQRGLDPKPVAAAYLHQ